MYTIYRMNKHNKDWTDDVLYTKAQAIKVLEEQGYRLNSGWYTRKEIGWEGDTKAMICKMAIYKD